MPSGKIIAFLPALVSGCKFLCVALGWHKSAEINSFVLFLRWYSKDPEDGT